MMEKFGRVEIDPSQKDYTTYKLSGKIKKVVYPKNVQMLKELVTYLNKENLKYKVLGNGSNVIFEDDYDGVIIKLNELDNLVFEDNIIKVESGYNLMKLALKTANMSLSGLEFAAGIPGTIGGAIYMNAGAYGTDISSVVITVDIIDDNNEIKTLDNKDLNFKYRHSILKEKNYICLGATIKLEPKNKDDILNLINERKHRRLETQPLEYPSAGSVFRNPEGMYAGKLIEDAGLKGVQIGDAKISEKHANFIINVGNAKGKDIKKLITLVKKTVKEKYGIDLKVEQEIIK